MERQYRILIVDDTPSEAEEYESYLVEEGYTIHIAEDCIQAKDILRKNAYHLAILDKNMPDFNGEYNEDAGVQLFEYIQSEYPYTTCIMATRHTEVDSVKRTIKGGVFDYLMKERIEAESLKQLVKKAFESRDTVVRAWGGYPEHVDPLDFFGQEGIMEGAVVTDSAYAGKLRLPSGLWEASIADSAHLNRINMGTKVKALDVKRGRIEVTTLDY